MILYNSVNRWYWW